MNGARIRWGVFFLLGITAASVRCGGEAPRMPGGLAETPPAIDGDHIFYSLRLSFEDESDPGAVVAVDKTTLEVLWSRAFPTTWGAPPIVDESGQVIGVYEQSSEPTLHIVSLNPDSGDVNWDFGETGGDLLSGMVLDFEDRILSVIREGDGDEVLLAVSSNDGSELWRVPASRSDTGLIRVDRQQVFISEGETESLISALSVADGSRNWTYSGAKAIDMIPGANDDLVVLTEDGDVVSIDRSTGNLLWKRDGDWSNGFQILWGYVTRPPSLLIGPDGEVFVFSHEGGIVQGTSWSLLDCDSFLWTLSGYSGKPLSKRKVFTSSMYADNVDVYPSGKAFSGFVVGASNFLLSSSEYGAGEIWRVSRSGDIVGSVQTYQGGYLIADTYVLDDDGKVYLANDWIDLENIGQSVVQTEEYGLARTPWSRPFGDLRNTGRIQHVESIYYWDALDLDPENEHVYGGINDEKNPWISQTAESLDGEDALMSAPVGNGEETAFTLYVKGAGTLHFFWRLTGDSGAQLTVASDGEVIFEAETYDEWIESRVPVLPEEHRIKITVSRPGDQSAGQSVGWLDKVSFEPEATRLLWNNNFDFGELEDAVVCRDQIMARASEDRIVSINEQGELVWDQNEYLVVSGRAWAVHTTMTAEDSMIFYCRSAIEQHGPASFDEYRARANLTAFSPDSAIRWQYSNSWDYYDFDRRLFVSGPSIGFAGNLFLITEAYIYDENSGSGSKYELVSYDHINGDVRFSREVEAVSSTTGVQILIAPTRLFRTKWSSETRSYPIEALRPSDGEQLWQTAIAGIPDAAGAIGNNNSIFFARRPDSAGDGEHGVIALAQDTGEILWEHNHETPVTSSLLFSSERHLIYATDDGFLWAISGDDGSEIWNSRVGTVVETPILGADDNLYLVTAEGTVKAIDLLSGDEVWEYALGSEPTFGPLMMRSGLLVVGIAEQFGGTSLYAFDTDSGGLGDDPWPKSMADYGNTGRVHIEPIPRLSIANEYGAKMLRVRRDPEKTTVVEYTSDFEQWTLFDSFDAGEDDVDISVESLPADTKRFFRARTE